jgi:hypothetical protein
VQYDGRIVGVGTIARGGTPVKPYDTAGGAETPGIMRGYCRATTLSSRQNYKTFQHGRLKPREVCFGGHPPSGILACASD